MTLLLMGATHVLVQLEEGERYPGVWGAHTDSRAHAMVMYEHITLSPKSGYSFAELKFYPWEETYAVITRHDWLKLATLEENEFGPVSP